MKTLVFGTVLPWLLLAVGTWLGYQLVRQNGRILLRLEAADEALTVKQVPHRPGTAPALGLRAGLRPPAALTPKQTGILGKWTK